MSLVNLPNLQELIDHISRERNLPKHAVENALREALLKGYERYRRTQRMDGNVQFEEDYFDNFDIELDTDEYGEQGFRVLASKAIVEEVQSADHEIALVEVQEVAPEAQLGDTVVLDVTPEQREFGRMAAIQTKQVLAQKLRDQQRKMIQEEFQDLEGTILNARVLRFERQSVIMAVSSSLGQPEVEAELLKRDQLPNDNYRANATFRVALKKVSEGSHRGPQLLVSRADASLVVELFSNEVPEIEDEIVRIVAVAREANPPSRSVGPRTKIAVDTVERDVDPVGACIGARGSRIQVVVNELRGEKIDVIRWSPDPATYIANALSPARVDEVRLMNPEERQAHVLVPEDQLSLAIGKEGQNVRLAARLTGWKIDIKDAAKYDYAAEDEKQAEIQAQREAQQQVALAATAATATDLEANLEDENGAAEEALAPVTGPSLADAAMATEERATAREAGTPEASTPAESASEAVSDNAASAEDSLEENTLAEDLEEDTVDETPVESDEAYPREEE
ncbi:Transcription termination/antitermination protein NusA [Halomicronema hongdechloris C2206]|uniref:Transcription termination/antitermination protein NusA n=1 Tax=Halomicronema hongdechloris C2206 TaxID=1641165 RepID=A0A1Z3HHU8_9CYAN|nr:transcription termination factor NusA [Halomicronema hongdechloris]ASC69843.1 Transcription termination/antitermination protein NusA [Halomicronema hongdechloris C2206]